jgi:serine/threonine protein kinase
MVSADMSCVMQLLGKGSFGSVYCVKRSSDRTLHVMKKISIQDMPPKERKATEQECKVLQRLRHPGTVDGFSFERAPVVPNIPSANLPHLTSPATAARNRLLRRQLHPQEPTGADLPTHLTHHAKLQWRRSIPPAAPDARTACAPVHNRHPRRA